MIEIMNLSKTYGGVLAASDVSFTAPQGVVTGFVGKNGAGKSTVLRMVAGVTCPDSGQVLVDGEPFAQASRPSQRMGVLLDAAELPSRSRAAALLAYVCDTQCLPHAYAARSLASVGLAHVGSKRVGELSLGMRQRLGIAIATIAQPRILVLDEPLNGLDPDGIQWLRDFVKTTANAGTAVLLSSHHMAELALVADRVVMIDHGRIIAAGGIDEFVGNRVSEDIYVESDELDALRLAFVREGWTVRLEGRGMIVEGISAHDVGRLAFTRGPGVTHLSREKRTLEQSYFELLREDDEMKAP